MTRIFPALGCVLLILAGTPVLSSDDHNAEDNPVTTAADAFGTSIGGESIGLYQAGDVRGFSPVDAGNVRLGGLYFDQQAAFTGRLVTGTTIRVGPTMLGDPFPAPTGIVEVRLREPGQQPGFRLVPQINSDGSRQLEIDARMPMDNDSLSVGAGIGQYEHRYPEGGDSSVTSVAVIGHWQPVEGVEIQPFWSHTDTRDMDVTPLVLVDDDHLPPEISRQRYASQRWATTDRIRANYGLIAGSPVGEWTLRTGLFRSVEKPLRSFSMQYRDTGTDGQAWRVAVANPSQRFASTSGEIRLSREMITGPVNHLLHLSLRGREQSRRYGGADSIELGPGRIGREAPVPEPDYRFGEQSIDLVSQWTGGIAYQARWAELAAFSVGVQRADYRKKVTLPEEPLPPTKERPWLYNASTAWQLSDSLALYANYSRGLEESPVAPQAAANRDEAPPAVRTEQTDFGLRWRSPRSLQLIAGVFRIDKPYFSMDGEDVFRQLGRQRHEGVELSLSGEPLPGMTLVLGSLLMDPEVSTQPTEHETVGRRPVGSVRRHFIAELDYRFPWLPNLSMDLSVAHASRRIGNLDNTLEVPATTTFNLGARYLFRWGERQGVLRLRLLNALDDFSWEVRGNGAFAYNAPRQVRLRATLDF